MRRAWSLLLLGACTSGGGALELQVEPAEGISAAKVELFLGMREDHRDDIRPAGFGITLPTVWWKRDRDGGRDVQKVEGDTVTYAFRPGGEEDYVRAVIAVGYDDAGTPVGVGTKLVKTPIPLAEEIHRYVIPLVAFDPADKAIGPNPGLQLWGPRGDEHACVHVTNVDGLSEYAPATSALITSASDPDCDGYDDGTPEECLPREFMAQKPMSRTSLSCLLEPTLTPPGGAPMPMCIAGGGTCSDGAGPDEQGCYPSSYCVPTGLCNTCEDIRCDGFLENRQAITHIQCTLPSGVENTTEQFCAPSVSLKLHELLPNVSCQIGAKLRDATRPWDVKLTYENGATIALEAVNAATCAYEITAAGAVPTASGSIRRDYPAIFSVPLLAPVKDRGLGLPILFQVVNTGCTSIASCTVVTATPDSLEACITTPVAPGTVVTD